MEKRCKRIEATVNLLPEPIIQHIQSFLNAKEAALTTLLSKPWHTAWLTRPTLELDEWDFINPQSPDFEKFAIKTVQRYQDLNLYIQRFRLRTTTLLAPILIVNAIKIGVTDLELDLPASFVFPREVFESKSIVRLRLAGGEIDGNHATCCLGLKSLKIDDCAMRSDNVLWNIITPCRVSIEEFSLSMSWFTSFAFRRVCPYELHKLKRLFLEGEIVYNTFFNDFASKFPCLKDLSLVRCRGYTRIEMASTSLECIRLVQNDKRRLMDKFDVPNIRKFTYSGVSVPLLSINKGRSSTRECEFDVSIVNYQFPSASWFLSFKRLLKKIRMSRITISLSLRNWKTRNKVQDDEFYNSFRVEPKRVPVESLTFVGLSKFCSVTTLLRLLGICCPSLITHYWFPELSTSTSWKVNNESLGMLYNELSTNQNTFGLNEVKVEIYEEIHKDEWRALVLEGPLDASKPPVYKCKVRFRLTWG